MTAASTYRCDPRAKVNMSLRVGGQREDGLHELASLVTFPEVTDALVASPDPDCSLRIASAPDNTIGQVPGGEDNLVLRAARAYGAVFRPPSGARFELSKRIPVAAGLGGGSADAAGALDLLSRMHGVPRDHRALAAIAWSIGADVPACLVNRASWIGGAGEQVRPLQSFPDCWLTLVSPGRRLSTAAVFEERDREGRPSAVRAPSPKGFDDLPDLLAWLKRAGNDLEASALRLEPACGAVRRALEATNALYVAMSGSGPTFFGVFHSASAARDAAIDIASRNPTWWCRSAAAQ